VECSGHPDFRSSKYGQEKFAFVPYEYFEKPEEELIRAYTHHPPKLSYRDVDNELACDVWEPPFL
jgi:hypothetical protein